MMFRYIISFILISAYCPSFGLPVKENVTPTPIGNKLLDLARECKNHDLSELIKSQTHRCNAAASVFPDLEKCLLFFDINRQLCSVDPQDIKFDLKEKYSLKIDDTQNVKTVCTHAQTWNFTTVEEYPEYNPEKVFKDEVLCVRMCSVDDFMSVDSNFFCKYYMWGMEILQSLTVTQSPVASNDTKATSQNDGTSVAGVATGKELNNNPTKIDTVNNEVSNVQVSGQSTSTHQSVSQQVLPGSEEKANPVEVSPKLSVVPIVKSNIPNPSEPIQSEIDRPPIGSSDPVLKPEEGQIVGGIKPPKEIDVNSEDDQEEDEEAYEMEDSGIKPNIKLEPSVDTKNQDGTLDNMPLLTDQELTHNAPLIDGDANTVFKPIINTEQKVSDTFPNLRQDSQDAFSDDDDNFFPFFLTGIVVVVLLYILYHNKNKFTKVILGLLVEGRQPGKRRNSRGHSYRRLDTLEQAMSTNQAAPPSKIIY